MLVALTQLPLANLKAKPARTALLVGLVALLSFALFAGSLVLASLSRGLTSFEERLGADLIVVPDEAKSKVKLEDILLDGVPGYFYMDDSYLGKIATLEGVEQASPQYYLATVKAGCCTMPVQIIGFDPSSDFSIQPWIARSYTNELGLDDIVAGSNITGAVGTTVLFYGRECRIVAKLAETGTALDNAVFATAETIKDLIAASEEQGLGVLSGNDPEHIISTIQVKVGDGYALGDIVDEINLHVRGVSAVGARAMTADVASGVAAVASSIRMLVGFIWVIAVVVLLVAFLVMGNHRVREFAILRMVGASRNELLAVVLKEAALISCVGAALGIALAALVVLGFNSALENALRLPFLLPKATTCVLAALLMLVVSISAGPLASAISAYRLSSVDAAHALREE